MKQHGTVIRDGDVVLVEAVGFTEAASLSGVECVNPDAVPEERVYRKGFRRKPIYLPGEYDRAVSEVLRGRDVLVLGMNGYSRLSPTQCAACGVKPGSYEAACEAILSAVIRALKQAFGGIDIRLSHGASDTGVDRSIVKVGRTLNCKALGHSCPKFMFWVLDDDEPVYVASTQDEYADSFIRSLDVLISANGRLQAFKHDINAAFVHLKHVIPINVLRSISTTGGPPAINAEGGIEDAVAAFEQRVHMMQSRGGLRGLDMWDEVIRHVVDATANVARQHLSPERAFGLYR